MASRSIFCRRLRQIIDLRDIDKSRYFAITRVVLSFDHRVCFFNEYLRETKRSAIFHTRAIPRRRKAWFHLRMSRILFVAKHLSQAQLDDIAHEQTITCRQLFAGHVMGSRPGKRSNNFHQMIM